MNMEEMRGLDVTELENKAKEMQEQLFRVRFQMGMGQTDGVKKLRETKKDRARILTVLNQRKKEGK
jgi:large subunit ribosomal protein L29